MNEYTELWIQMKKQQLQQKLDEKQKRYEQYIQQYEQQQKQEAQELIQKAMQNRQKLLDTIQHDNELKTIEDKIKYYETQNGTIQKQPNETNEEYQNRKIQIITGLNQEEAKHYVWNKKEKNYQITPLIIKTKKKTDYQQTDEPNDIEDEFTPEELDKYEEHMKQYTHKDIDEKEQEEIEFETTTNNKIEETEPEEIDWKKQYDENHIPEYDYITPRFQRNIMKYKE